MTIEEYLVGKKLPAIYIASYNKSTDKFTLNVKVTEGVEMSEHFITLHDILAYVKVKTSPIFKDDDTEAYDKIDKELKEKYPEYFI